MENKKELLERMLMISKYDTRKTLTENLVSIDEEIKGVKGIQDLKAVEAEIRAMSKEFEELFSNGVLKGKGNKVIRNIDELISDFKSLSDVSKGVVVRKIMNSSKAAESLTTKIAKDVTADADFAKKYGNMSRENAKRTLMQVGYDSEGAEKLLKSYEGSGKQWGKKIFNPDHAVILTTPEEKAKFFKKLNSMKPELKANKGLSNLPQDLKATNVNTAAEAQKEVVNSMKEGGVDASRAEKIGNRLGKISAKSWDIIKSNASKLSWKTLIKYGIIGVTIYGAYKWIFDDDKELPPPPCIGGNDNFKPSADAQGNIVWVLKSSEKHPKGILMNFNDNTCEDRATGRKGKWSCSETDTAPTITKESVDEIYERFSFLLQEEIETYGNVTINWDEQGGDSSSGGGDSSSGSGQQTFPIPTELKDEEGVRKFQTWMEANHKGWYTGSRPVDGIFGKQTSAAWDKYKDEYLKSLTSTSGTTSGTTSVTTPGTTSGTTTPQAAPQNVQQNVTTLTKDQQDIIDRFIKKGYIDLGLGKRISPDISPKYTEFNLKGDLKIDKDYFVYLKNTDVVPNTVQTLAQSSIKEDKISRASCRTAIKTFYVSFDTGIELDEETFNKLKTKVQRCRKQYDDFFDLDITNKKLNKLYNLAPDNKYYISDKRNMGENNSTNQLKGLIRENLMKVKEVKTTKLLSEEKIIKTRYSILVEGRKLKTETDFRNLADEIINETIYLKSQNFNNNLINEGLIDFFMGLPYGESITEYFKEQFLKWIIGKFGIPTDSFWFGVIDKAFGNVDLKDYPKLLECSFLTTTITDAFAEQGINEIQKRVVGSSPIADISRNMMMELFKSSDVHKAIEDGIKKHVCVSLTNIKGKMTSLLGSMSDKISAPTNTPAAPATTTPATT